jgi:hypothetical protein
MNNRTTANPATLSKTTQEAEELEAYVDLGIASEAIPLARKALKRRPVNPHELSLAVQVASQLWPRVKPWVPLIEAAYNVLNKRGRESVRFAMLAFYVNLDDWSKASLHVIPRPTSPRDLTLTMYTLLNLRKMVEAECICRRCLRALKRVTDPESRSMLLDALADYYAQTGDLERAETCWHSSPPGEAFASQAAIGLIKIQAARGLRYVATALASERRAKQLGRFDAHAPKRSRLSYTERQLLRFQDAFQRVLPEKNQHEFGIPPASQQAPATQPSQPPTPP